MGVGTARGSRPLARRNRLTGFGCGLALATGATVLTVIVLTALALFVLLPREGPSASAVVPAQPGALTWDSAGRTTVLLVSTADGSNAPATGFTVLSYASSTRRLNLLSIPANLWVTIPGFGQGPLGQAYADGGVRLMLVTVQSVLGMPVPYYAIAGARTVAQMVDALGGILVDFPLRTALDVGGRARVLGPGPVHLNAAESTAYLAQTQAAGYGPAEQLLLSLVHATQTPDNKIRLPSVLDSLGSSITTNFPLNRVPDLLTMLDSAPPGNVRRSGLGPDTGTAVPYTTAGVQVYLPHWDRIHALARRLLAGPPMPGSVDVLNGSGVPGQAAALTAWLRSAAVPVGGYDTAPTDNYARTQVIVRPGAGGAPSALARVVAALLQVPLVTGPVPTHKSPVAIIIGRDFQSPAQQ